MPIIFIVVLIILFVVALALVLMNNAQVAVDLLFTQVPSMNLGLLLILALILGIAIGLLLGFIVFRVVQNRLEIGRLKKENDSLQVRLTEAERVLGAPVQPPVTATDI